jgi:hypothetical protein
MFYFIIFCFCLNFKTTKIQQYKMHGGVINVFTNVDQTQSILPCLSHDGAIICVFLKQHLEYKSPYQEMFVQIW